MIPENFVLPSASASISEKMASLSTESENVRVEDAVKNSTNGDSCFHGREGGAT